MGTVEAIHVIETSGGDPTARERVEAVAGRGLRGDRYFDDQGTFSGGHAPGTDDVTLIEAEAIEAVARDYDLSLAPGEHRRNVTTRGVALNHLVGRRFVVGDVVCEGIEL